MLDVAERAQRLLVRLLPCWLACAALACSGSDATTTNVAEAGAENPARDDGGATGSSGSPGGGPIAGADASTDAPSTGPDAGDAAAPCDCPARADVCGTSGITHYAPTGTCDGAGACTYQETTSPCNTPPASTCAGSTQVVYASAGTCAAGASGVACTYPSTSSACASGCATSGDLCQGDPCAGNTCATGTPANTCAGLSFTGYGTSTCDGANGSCVAHPTVTACDLGNPCVAYGCSPTVGCTSQPKPDFTTSCGPSSFCRASSCVPRQVTLSVAPTTATIHAGGTARFTATTASNDPSDQPGVSFSESAPGLGNLVTTSALSASFTANPPPSTATATETVTVQSALDPTVTATATVTIAPDLVIGVFVPNDSLVHAGQLTAVEATITGLTPTDSGQATMAVIAGDGAIGPVTCDVVGTTSTCTAIFHAGAVGTSTVRVTSVDEPSQAVDWSIRAKPAVTLSVSPTTLELVSFGSTGFPRGLTCTLNDLFPGDPSGCTFTLTSGTSVTMDTSSTLAAVTAVPSPNGAFWFDAPPGPSVITVTAPAYPGLQAAVTVNVHAWVQDRGGVNQGLDRPTSVAISPTTGDPVFGGVGGSGGGTNEPSVLSRISGFGWGALLQSPSQGSVAHVTTGDGATFFASGVLTSPTPSNFVVGGPLTATTVLSPGGNLAVHATDVNAVGHTVVSSATDLFYFYNEVGATTCNDTTQGVVLRRSLAGGGWTPITLGDETAFAGNSCPFTPVNNRRFESMTLIGGAVWLGGLADCGTTGCSSPFGFHGLVGLDPRPGGAWSSWQGAAASQDVRNPVVKAGYDRSVLAINGAPATDAFPQSVNLLWMPASALTESPAGAHFGPALANAYDVGDTIGGAAGGGSPWAANQPDVFFAYTEGVSGHHYVGWQIGSTARVVDTTANGDQIYDVEFATVNGVVQAWAAGLSSPAGQPSTPLFLHLQ